VPPGFPGLGDPLAAAETIGPRHLPVSCPGSPDLCRARGVLSSLTSARASPPPEPSGKGPESWELGRRCRDPWKEGARGGSGAELSLPLWPPFADGETEARAAGWLSRAPVGTEGQYLMSVLWGVCLGRFGGVCGSLPGRAVGVLVALMARSAFSFSFLLPG
jgi:hypothetical protein